MTTAAGNTSLQTENSVMVTRWTCEGRISPSAPELLKKLSNADTSVVVAMCVPPLLLGIMAAIFADEMFFIVRQPMPWRRKTYYAWILSCYPVLGMLNVIGLFMPASSGVISFASSFFFAICVKKFSQEVLELYGGKAKMAEALQGQGVIPPNPFPFCCIVCCCRNQPMTEYRITKLQAVIYQVIFIYPLVYFLQTLLATEGYTRTPRGMAVLNVIGYLGGASSFVALYGFIMMARVSSVALQQYRIRWKYLCIQLVVACNTLQGFTLGVLQRYDKLSCGFPYPDPKMSFVLHTWILTIELFVLSVFAWFAYRRSEVGCHVVIAQSDIVTLTKVKAVADVTTDEDESVGEPNTRHWSYNENNDNLGINCRNDHEEQDSKSEHSFESYDNKAIEVV